MKKKNFTNIIPNKLARNICLACLFCLGIVSGANAAIFITLTSPQTTYTPGVNNTFTFNIGYTQSGAEYVDRYQFAFPAGVTVVSGTPASGAAGCASNAGIQQICNPMISWTKTGVPCTGAFTLTGCGAYNAASVAFTVTVSVPAGMTGPMVVTLNSQGDGFGAAPHSATNTVTFAQVVPFVPCAIVCPANMTVTLDPGACNAILSYNVPTTGQCFIGGNLTGFQGAYAPSAINYYQYDAGIFTNPPTPFSNGYAITFNSPTNTTLQLKSSDFGFSPGPTLYFFNGVEWTNTSASSQNVSFNWNYSTADSGPFWDHFDMMIGTAAQNFANSNFGNQENLWTQISNAGGASVQSGVVTVTIPAGRRLALAAYTLDAGGGPATISISNFVVSQIVPAVPHITSGLPSGSEFPIGTTTNCYSVTANNAAGTAVTTSCCFNITVNEFPSPSTTLACNDNVQVSVDANCEAFVSTSMILEGDVYGCYDDYIVSIQGFGSGNGGVLINSSAVGQTLNVTISDPSTGNSCWGTISVEDKLPPTIECRPVTILCGEALPTDPAPELIGYQNILYTGLNDLVENNSFTYNFDFSYLPTATPVLDVDVRIKIDDHTWLPDLNVQLTSPSGLTKSIFTIGGCIGQEWPINCILDDAGSTITLCMQLNAGDMARLMPLQAGVSMPILFNFNGLDASGIWKVKISDNAAGDDGHIRAVGVFINVNLPQVDPSDNCGDVDLAYTDTESGDPCTGLLITRHWIATDQSGNTAACDQVITVLPLVLDSVDCPVAYVGHCGESTDPTNTGWPSVNGTPITDDNNVCNIFVGFWDHELNDCGNGIKIVRTWTILDWCTQTTLECVQVIKLADDQAPLITCPSNLTVGTAFWYCYANVSVPKPTVTDACGSAFTLSLTASAGQIVNFGNNYVLNQLPLGTVTVTWTATDECGNSSSCSFTVTVVDDVVPVANCDEHTVVGLTNDGPFGITLVPAKVFDDGSYDNCGPVTFRARRMDSCIDFDWTTDGACVDDIPGGSPPVNSRDKGTVSRPCVPFACCDVGAGPIMVELEVTDASGNRNFCMVEAIVQDKISPFVQCPPDITVSCDFWFNVQEGTFVDEDGNNNGNLDEDPLSPVFGNMFDAFQYNDDESVRQDIIINDPGNPNVSHPHFWGIDGWADDNCEVNLQVRVRVVNDCSGEALPAGAPAGAVKLIERRFSASDGNQGIAPGTCTQRIWVVDFDPFFITDVTCGLYNNDDVVWPCDVLLTSCPDDLGDTGEPIVYDDACSLIGVAYEDQRFDFVDGACFKILRTWSVIDWCQYNSLTGEGLWHYVQVIKVHDNVGPEFLNCPTGPVTLCVADPGVTLPNNNQAFLGHDNPLSTSCSVHLNLCQAVHETCSDIVNYDVKLYLFNGDEFIYVKPLTSIATDSSHNASLCFDTRQNSSQVIRNNGIPYNSPFCGDYHKLLWSAEDGCGNWSHCEYLIRLEDCKQPSPVCINGLSTVVMPFGGQVTIWAKDFNASSFDDCTAEEDLLYSFSGETYTPSFTYTCDNVPAFGVELSVNIWVADGGTDDNCNGQISWSERNKDFCTTTIVITDNAGVCPDTTGSVLLAGEVLTEDVQSVEKVSVTLTSPGHVFPTYVTVEDGKYNFSNIIIPENYTLNAERNDAFRNGVSTLDLVRIQKHLLGIEPLSSPYDLIAADANNSQSVSAIDLVELRKLILGIYTELPANKSWRFVDKSFQFADPTHPWPFTESINVANIATSQYNKDFVAIKVGDVNNTVQANATQVLPRSEKGVVKFVANDRIVTTGEMVDIAISSEDFAAIEGYQFTLQTQGLEFRGVESGIVSMNDENMGVFGSTLTASWHKVGGVSATASDVLFTLKFQATAPGKLSTMIALNSKETQAEAYNTMDDIKGLKLTFRGAEHGAEFALYQNEPNPFKGNTVIGYDLPQAGKVTLTLFDVTGKVLLVKDQDSVKGYNTISVSSKLIPSVGVLYYRLDANEYTATKKMVIIE